MKTRTLRRIMFAWAHPIVRDQARVSIEHGHRRRTLRTALMAALICAAYACGPAVPGGGGSGGGGGANDPRCAPYCDARQTKGCGGDRSLCMLACSIDYQVVATSQGKCAQAYTTLLDCKQNPSILDLGCSPPSDKTSAACKAQSDAYEACVKERDGS
ncbi:MAG TPA: hypothetical protein VJT73_11655 [Polyangiaceae bacterium]|nr:hypothetical protein [Polyangiaceae bacterium]